MYKMQSRIFLSKHHASSLQPNFCSGGSLMWEYLINCYCFVLNQLINFVISNLPRNDDCRQKSWVVKLLRHENHTVLGRLINKCKWMSKSRLYCTDWSNKLKRLESRSFFEWPIPVHHGGNYKLKQTMNSVKEIYWEK